MVSEVNASTASSIDVKQKLNDFDIDTEDAKTLFEMLEITYPLQRQFINNCDNPPDVQEIKKERPILFTPIALTWHFKKLTRIDIDCLKQNIQLKAKKIINCGIKQKVISANDVKRGETLLALLSLDVILL